MKHKTVVAEATTELGEFEAIAAAWSVDRTNEAIRRGAFAKTITKWRASGKRIPLHWSHGGAPEDIIGSVDPASMHETNEGLRVSGKLDLDGSEQARSTWRAMKGNVVGLSFGYLTTKERKRRDGVTELVEVDLFEVSLTPAPANADTRVLSMKSLDDPAERMITIAGRDGRPRVVRAGDEFWWEADERKALAEWQRKSMPVEIASFEV